MNRRRVLLVLSLVVAAVGTAMIGLYVKAADDRAATGQERVSVVVAAKPISAGTTVDRAQDAAAFETVPMPRNNVPSSAYLGLDGLEKLVAEHGDDTAQIRISPRTPITAELFRGEDDDGAVSGLADGEFGVEVTLESAPRAASTLVPEMEITVLATVSGTTRVVVPRARVVSVGGRSDLESTGKSGGGGDVANNVYVAVSSQKTAVELALAATQSVPLWFIVPGTDQTRVDDGVTATVRDLAR